MSRHDFIWLASWPRSGNTLLRTVLWHCFGLKSGSVYPKDLDGNTALENYVGHVARADLESFRRHQKPAFIKTHGPPEDHRPAIYVVRDGRPACVSFWKFFKQEIPLADVVSGKHYFESWARNLAAWDPANRPNTLLLKYEDLVRDLDGVLREIEAFIGCPILTSEIPPRNEIAGLGGRHVNQFSDWSEVLKGEALSLFWEVNGEMMKEIYNISEG